MDRMARMLAWLGNWGHRGDVLVPMHTSPMRLLPVMIALLLFAAACGADGDITANAEPTPDGQSTPIPQPTVATPPPATPAPPTPAPVPPTPEPEPTETPGASTTTAVPGTETTSDSWEELQAAELAWARSSILSYEYTLHESCECDDSATAPRRIRVEGGQVVSVENDGEPSPHAGYSIDDVFRQARTALFNEQLVKMGFAANGVPTDGIIDVEGAQVDGGFVFDITDFTVVAEGAPVDNEYLDALTQWRTARIGSYFVGYAPLCFCIPIELDVTVTNGAITNVVAVLSGTNESTQHPASDIDEMFVQLRNAIVGDAHEISVDYDPIYGRPVSFFIDVDEQIADEEWGVQIFAFEPDVGTADGNVEYPEFCAAVTELVSIDDNPDTADGARRSLNAMVDMVEAVVANAPAEVEPATRELRSFINAVYDHLETADWDPQEFDDLDSVIVDSNIDVELLEGFFTFTDNTCEP